MCNPLNIIYFLQLLTDIEEEYGRHQMKTLRQVDASTDIAIAMHDCADGFEVICDTRQVMGQSLLMPPGRGPEDIFIGTKICSWPTMIWIYLILCQKATSILTTFEMNSLPLYLLLLLRCLTYYCEVAALRSRKQAM